MDSDTRARDWNPLWLSLTGLCIGLLVGMSSSPVAGVSVAALLGAAAAVTTVLMGIDDRGKANRRVTALPLLALVGPMLFGVASGVAARTRLLPPEPSSLEGTIKRWSTLTHLPDTIVARRVFEGVNFEAFSPTVAPLAEVRADSAPADPCLWKGGEVVAYDARGARRISLATYCDSIRRSVGKASMIK